MRPTRAPRNSPNRPSDCPTTAVRAIDHQPVLVAAGHSSLLACPQQEAAAKAYLAQLASSGRYDQPVVTQLAPLAAFYPAEGYHQDYLESHRSQPYIVHNDLPKLEQLRTLFPESWR